MRWSRYYLGTAREAPREAEVISHQLMVRAGMIRRHAAGIYSYLPFGWRSIAKLMAIVRRELDAAGGIELSMPAVQPAELWEESGRWQKYGVELLRFTDRHQREFCFGPTHEEVITDIVRRDVSSYRQLPVNLYQIQVKFRDEIRPRFGLMRGREFLMKDGYSFHADRGSLEETYAAMEQAYRRIFTACRLDHTVVEADTGAIGGSASHEFMVVADTGESAIVRCPDCGYAANVEKARARPLVPPPAEESAAFATVPTPGAHTVEEVTGLLGIGAERLVKTLLYEAGGETVAVLVRGDRELNEIQLAHHLDVPEVRLAEAARVEELTGAPVGFAGPIGLAAGVRVVADRSLAGLTNFVCGANAADAHLRGVQLDRDLQITEWADLMLVRGGDGCPNCEGSLEESRGIEVGHIFQLGTRYSEAMRCHFTDETGAEQPAIMGCYGLGIGRTVAAAIEQNHDEAGIVWPLPLAPYAVLLIALNPDDAAVGEAAERLYAELSAAGVEVLYDDRPERPGVKFNDADLIGLPIRVVVGAKSLAGGEVELSLRRDRVRQPVAVADAVARVRALLDELS